MSQHYVSRIFLLLAISCAFHTKYPESWWTPVPQELASPGEILPQTAKPKKEVVLSKRNELGVLSPLAPTPFYFYQKRYATVESFWQMMKFPDPEYKNDPRNKVKFPYTREAVAALNGPEARAAGDRADELMKELNINWVTFEGKRMPYCSEKPGQHLYLIREVMIKKLRYNYDVRRWLLATGNLKLKPDHQEEETCKGLEWKYYELWMEIRKTVMRSLRLAPIVQP